MIHGQKNIKLHLHCVRTSDFSCGCRMSYLVIFASISTTC